MGSPSAIPKDWPVQPIDPDDPTAVAVATCGACGLSWDDGRVTSMTPAPSARCPFEQWHEPEPARAEQIAAARELYANDDLQIDDNATVSDAMPEGYWVSAWVWVPGGEES